MVFASEVKMALYIPVRSDRFAKQPPCSGSGVWVANYMVSVGTVLFFSCCFFRPLYCLRLISVFLKLFCLYLSRMNKRHGHGMWWMSAGRKKCLKWRTHPHSWLRSGVCTGRLSPFLTVVRALQFNRGNTSPLSSLVDSRRISPTHAWRSQQLIPFLFNKIRTW